MWSLITVVGLDEARGREGGGTGGEGVGVADLFDPVGELRVPDEGVPAYELVVVHGEFDELVRVVVAEGASSCCLRLLSAPRHCIVTLNSCPCSERHHSRRT